MPRTRRDPLDLPAHDDGAGEGDHVRPIPINRLAISSQRQTNPLARLSDRNQNVSVELEAYSRLGNAPTSEAPAVLHAYDDSTGRCDQPNPPFQRGRIVEINSAQSTPFFQNASILADFPLDRAKHAHPYSPGQ